MNKYIYCCAALTIFASSALCQIAVQGPAPSASPAVGNPVIVAGTDGTNVRALKTDVSGGLASAVSGGTAGDGRSGAAFSVMIQSTGSANNLGIYPWVFNGVTWDRQYVCSSSAVVSVTNATTGQLVALTSGQTIRVCGIVLTSTAATTATLSYGTGTTCGTGNAPLSGAMALGASTAPLTISLGADGALRTAAGNALCLAAGATTVTGFITYAKY